MAIPETKEKKPENHLERQDAKTLTALEIKPHPLVQKITEIPNSNFTQEKILALVQEIEGNEDIEFDKYMQNLLISILEEINAKKGKLDKETILDSLINTERLRKSESSKKIIGKIADVLDRGKLESVIGTIMPVGGDIAPSLVATAYFLYVAKEIGLDWKKVVKLIFSQVSDVGIGSVPVIGDFIDAFLINANIEAEEIFNKHRIKLGNNLVKNLTKLGFIEEKAKKIKGQTIRAGQLSSPIEMSLEVLNSLVSKLSKSKPTTSKPSLS